MKSSNKGSQILQNAAIDDNRSDEEILVESRATDTSKRRGSGVLVTSEVKISTKSRSDD